jgi:hypothetical protein
MVTTRKTPVAPVPTGSRTNSSQAIPRAGKAKSALSGDSEPAARENPTPSSKNVSLDQPNVLRGLCGFKSSYLNAKAMWIKAATFWTDCVLFETYNHTPWKATFT